MLSGTGLEVASTEHQELLDDTYLIFRIPRPTADSDNNDACTPDIALPGMARKLYLHQLKDVAFLAQQTQTRGGCVAEPPGLGKVCSTLAMNRAFLALTAALSSPLSFSSSAWSNATP